jgi:transposase
VQVTEELVLSLLARIEQLETRLRHVEASRAKLIRQNRRLRQDNALLKEKVRELTARLNADSTNSSKPPSTDTPWKERRVQKPSGRPSGAQPGHVGRSRTQFAPGEIDHEVSVVPRSCGKCGHRLGENHTTGQVRRHQVVELPPVVAEVTEYALHESKCPGCGHTTTADLPEGVPNSCAGVRFQAILSLLTGRCRITRREAREVVVEMFGPKAEVGTPLLSMG